ALQAAADRLSPDIIRRRLDYWTLILGPKFSKKERAQLNLSRLYAISKVEYCRNFIFKRHFPIHKLFERGCELGLWRLGADKIAAIFGTRLNRRMRGKLATVEPMSEPPHSGQADPRKGSRRLGEPSQQASRKGRLAIHHRRRPRKTQEALPLILNDSGDYSGIPLPSENRLTESAGSVPLAW